MDATAYGIDLMIENGLESESIVFGWRNYHESTEPT